MSDYKFLWRGQSPEGKADSTKIVAPDAQSARQSLELAGWTQLELVGDEIASQASAMVETGDLEEPLFESAAEEIDYFEGRQPGLLRASLRSLWDFKWPLAVGVAMIFAGHYTSRLWPQIAGWILAGFAVLFHPVVSLLFGGSVRHYARLNRAKVWGRWPEVLECVERLRTTRLRTSMGVGDVELDRCRAQALAAMGKLDEAIREFSRHETAPGLERWMYLSQLSTIYDTAKAFEKSLACREEAAREKPDNCAMWIDLAYGLVRGLNRPAEAREALARAEKLEPTALAKAYLPFLRGVVAWREGDFAEAKKLSIKALATLAPYKHNDLALGLLLLSKSYLCAAHRGLGEHDKADRLLRSVEKYLIAQREDELLAACRGAGGGPKVGVQ